MPCLSGLKKVVSNVFVQWAAVHTAMPYALPVLGLSAPTGALGVLASGALICNARNMFTFCKGIKKTYSSIKEYTKTYGLMQSLFFKNLHTLVCLPTSIVTHLVRTGMSLYALVDPL